MASSLSGMFARAIQTVKPHVPMIKFRKGGHNLAGGHGSTPVVHQTAVQTQGSGAAKVTVRPTIEDYQLPLRYRRQEMDQYEIDAINSGGAY